MDLGARPLEKAAHKHPVVHTHKRCWAEMQQRKRLAVLRTVVRKKAAHTAAERMRQAGLDMGRWPARRRSAAGNEKQGSTRQKRKRKLPEQ